MKKKEERERANPGRLFQQHLKNYSADHTEKKIDCDVKPAINYRFW